MALYGILLETLAYMNTYAQNRAIQIERDHKILRFLAGGPSTFDAIRRRCFVGESLKTPCPRTCSERLNKLCQHGYIQKKRFAELDHLVTVYALTALGRSELSMLLDKDSIRINITGQHHLRHELLLSDIARKILDEFDEGKYTISFMHDDRALLHNRKKRKSEYYPDLFLEIIRPGISPLRLNLELDAGKKGSVYWRGKLTSWEHTSLVLVPEADRINKLISMLAGSNHSVTIGFATVDEFLKSGLSDTVWSFLPDLKPLKIRMK